MASEDVSVSALRSCWSQASRGDGTADYHLLGKIGQSYAASSHDGFAALVVPLPRLDSSVSGRRASGCDLIGHTSLRFTYEGRQWDGPAAALVCSEPGLLDTFAVLAADVSSRAGSDPSWQSVLMAVEEWQTLLAARGRPSIEMELGLWGELWFLAQSLDMNRALLGWRGPELDATDFFLEGIAAEVKTSKHRRQHHVSQSQIDTPVGPYESWILSLWVKTDPAAEITVPWLVDRILERAPDRALALRKIASAGFSPSDRQEYIAGMVLLAEPEWYATEHVPRVRTADPGVSHLRYRIVLDETRRAEQNDANRLWQHFHGSAYRDIKR